MEKSKDWRNLKVYKMLFKFIKWVLSFFYNKKKIDTLKNENSALKRKIRVNDIEYDVSNVKKIKIVKQNQKIKFY